jgi:hypothetical protein
MIGKSDKYEKYIGSDGAKFFINKGYRQVIDNILGDETIKNENLRESLKKSLF